MATACGGEGCQTTIKFLAAQANEGEPEIVYDATADVILNSGPQWGAFPYTVTAREGCIDYGCPPVQEVFIDVDVDVDVVVIVVDLHFQFMFGLMLIAVALVFFAHLGDACQGFAKDLGLVLFKLEFLFEHLSQLFDLGRLLIV